MLFSLNFMFLNAVSWRAEFCRLGELGNKKNSSLSGTVVNRAYQISIQTIHQPLDGFLSVVVSTLLLLHSWCFLYPRYPCSPPGTPSPPQPPGWSFSRSQPCSPTPTTIKCYCSDIRRWRRRQFHVFNRSFMTFCVIYRVQKKIYIRKTSCAENHSDPWLDSITVFPKYSSKKHRKMMTKFRSFNYLLMTVQL